MEDPCDRPRTLHGPVVLVPLLLLGALAAGCERAAEASHERMLGELAELAADIDTANRWLGDSHARELREKLAGLDPAADPIQRTMTLQSLGNAELELGNDDDAIGHLEDVVTTIRGTPNAPSWVLTKALFDLGVAHLRVAENRNCVCDNNPERCRFPIVGAGVHEDAAPARRAAEVLAEVAAREPDRLDVRWLLNIAHMTLGDYPDGVPAAQRIDPARFESDEAFPHFADVAARAGVGDLSLSGGALAEDYDGDGHLDIVVTSWDPTEPMRYFHGRGDGTFEERPDRFAGLLGGLNAIHADYDGDGDVDLYVLRGAWLGRDGAHPNSLLRNDGHGRFTDVTYLVGLGASHHPSQAAAWADFDGDGDLDLYVGNEDRANVRNDCQLFRQGDDGTFEDVAPEMGVTNGRFAKGVAWGDFDGDDDPDLYVSNMAGPNRLYRNDGDRFVDVAVALGVTEPVGSFPTWFWDFDNDGVLDIFVAGYGADWVEPALTGIVRAYMGFSSEATTHRLYRGDGHGGFEDATKRTRLTRPTLPMGANFGDLDLDGYLDFYLGTGEPALRSLMPNVLYRNRAGREFADVTTAGGFGHLQKGHGVVFADFDEDGDLDVFERMGGAYVTDVFVDALYENPGFDAHWLRVSLSGRESNRAGLGARIRAQIVEDGNRRSIYRHVGSGGSFGANPMAQTLGLGAAERVEVLEVRWPATGRTQRFEDVEADRWLRITEGESTFEDVPLQPPRRVH